MVILAAFLCAPTLGLAYAPAMLLPEGAVALDPLTASVFFGELHEESAVVRFRMIEGGKVYLNLMTPVGANKDGKFDAVLVNESRGDVTAVLEAGSLPWQPYRDQLLAENFLRGPELSMEIPSGEYRVVVTSPGNLGKFGLQIGEEDRFSLRDYFTLYQMGPSLKRDFFATPPFSFFLSIVGFIFTFCFMVLGMLVGHTVAESSFFVSIWKKLWGWDADIPLFQLVTATMCAIFGLAMLLVSLLLFWNTVLIVVSGALFYCAARGARRVHTALRAV